MKNNISRNYSNNCLLKFKLNKISFEFIVKRLNQKYF